MNGNCSPALEAASRVDAQRAILRVLAWLRGVAWVVWACAIGLPVAAAAEPSATRRVAERTLAATVGVRCEIDFAQACAGTGVVISPSGHVLTATSVVPPGARKIRVTFPGFVVRDATLVATDASLAVAIVKVEGDGLPFLPLSRDMPAVGSTAYTGSDVQNALLTNGRAFFSRGLVSGIYEVPKHPESAYSGIAIETTAAINPGSDGGPLVDEAGCVCGVISLCMLPLRWQGTAVPTKVLLEKFAPFTSGAVPLPQDPAAAREPPSSSHPLAAAAAGIADRLVGIEVTRTFAVESLPQPSWQDFRDGIEGYAALPEAKQRQMFAEYLGVVRTFEVNQLLRRPPGPATGLVISADGFLLTSLFNVGDDTAFIRKATGSPRAFDPREPIAKLFAEPEGGLEQRPNVIEKIEVVLRNGTRHAAKVVARHQPLGVAVLKIEANELPWCDVAGDSTSPQLGDAVGIVGYLPGGDTPYTLNAGIISAASRMRGYQLQTDALLNYGNSGGPLVDRDGNLLGIATAPIQPDTLLGRLAGRPQLIAWTRAPNSGVGMAARADRIRDVLDELKAGKSFNQIPGPFLGLQPDASKAFGDEVVIGGVAGGSPAEKAGLKRGDVLLELDGAELRSWNDLTERIAAAKVGQVVEFKVLRRGAGPRLLIAGQEVATAADLERLKKSLKPDERFEGVLSTDDTRTIQALLGEAK